MKKFFKILVCIICLLGFTTNAKALSGSISVYQKGTDSHEFIDGLEIYNNKSGSYNVYVLNTNTYFSTNTTYLSNPVEVDKGFSYIINNSNVTNNSDKNYYIAQVAILWFEDYLNGNNQNISSAMKDTISKRNSDTVCYYITKLVNAAKEYSKNENSISFVDEKITFTKMDGYYYSNIIDVKANGLNNKPSVSLYNAPTGATIIDNTIINNGTGSFQIRIPANSIDNNDEKDFIVNVTGSSNDYTYYKYSKDNSNYVIYSKAESSKNKNIEASMVAKISEINSVDLKFRVFNSNGNYISGLKYEVYNGNCMDTNCNIKDLVTSFNTKKTYTTLSLNDGVYTFVLLDNNEYNLPNKKVLNLSDNNDNQYFEIREDISEDSSEKNENKKHNLKIYSDFNDHANTIKILNDTGIVVDSYKSSEESHLVSLYSGTYTIFDTKGLIELNFEINADGDLYVQIGSTKVKKDVINLNEYLIRKPVLDTDKEETSNENIKEEDNVIKEENVYKDEDGTIHIDNLEGIESIEVNTNAQASVTIDWLTNIVDCPITSLSSTIKYIIGAIVLGAGICLVVRNVKKYKNNN